ncbi:hypothetical protein HYW30_01085 [Candidatus Azambacteria bacterium]|nr:hypothetical protein [Candidatus Azambacteria bacterium]
MPYSSNYLGLRARQGKLKAIKVGRDWMTTEAWVREYLDYVEDFNRQVAEARKHVAVLAKAPTEILPPPWRGQNDRGSTSSGWTPGPIFRFLEAGVLLVLFAVSLAVHAPQAFGEFLSSLDSVREPLVAAGKELERDLWQVKEEIAAGNFETLFIITDGLEGLGEGTEKTIEILAEGFGEDFRLPSETKGLASIFDQISQANESVKSKVRSASEGMFRVFRENVRESYEGVLEITSRVVLTLAPQGGPEEGSVSEDIVGRIKNLESRIKELEEAAGEQIVEVSRIIQPIKEVVKTREVTKIVREGTRIEEVVPSADLAKITTTITDYQNQISSLENRASNGPGGITNQIIQSVTYMNLNTSKRLDLTGGLTVSGGNVTVTEAGAATVGSLTVGGSATFSQGATLSGNLNFSNNQATNFRAENVTSNPTAGNAGRLVFNTSDNTLYVDNGTSFTAVGADTLQNAYASGNTITTSNNRNLTISLADTATDSSFIVDILGTGNVFEVRDGGNLAFQIADKGLLTASSTATTQDAFTFNATSLTSGDFMQITVPQSGLTGDILKIQNNATTPSNLFRILSTGAFSVSPTSVTATSTIEGSFRVDTTDNVFTVNANENRVGIGTANPATLFDITGTGSARFRVDTAGGIVASSTNTTADAITVNATSLTSGDAIQITVPQSSFTGDALRVETNATTPAVRFKVDTSGNTTLGGYLIGVSGTNTTIRASGATSGSTSNGSIYFADSSGTVKARIDTTASGGGASYGTLHIGATNTSAADLAEYYPAIALDLSPGDVVKLATATASTTGESIFGIVKTNQEADSGLLGVISTQAGLILGADDLDPGQSSGPGGKALVALAGRVPVKVTSENGAISPGDYLTASDIPGVAQKAASPGPVVGMALEAFDEGEGTIQVFLQAQWSASMITRGSQEALSYLEEVGGKLTVKTDLDLEGHAIVNVGRIESLSGKWSIDEQGNIVVQNLEVKGIIVGSDYTRGSATIPAGYRDMAVTFSTPAAKPPKAVVATPTWNARVWVSDVSTGGFSLHFDAVSPEVAAVYWQAQY